jgi:ATP phosphoribosyltransferase
MRAVTPRGFRDVLFAEAAERGAVAGAIADSFARCGYALVETPVVERYATLEAGAGRSLEGTAFRLVDVDGSLLALRPEMTVPIARLAASRLAGVPGPHRVAYVAEVFRERESLRGEARQFTQAGVELLGTSGAAADAEVVTALVEALAAAGLREFTVGLGTVAVLRALLEACGGSEEWRDAVIAAAHQRNLVAIDRLVDAPGIAAAAGAALRRIVRIGGGAEAIAAGREVAASAGCAASLDTLDDTWALLEAAGVAGRVRVDFGILRSFDYYTGLIVEAYAPGLGLPLGGGGRYDDLLATFGAPMPAAGFALALERVMIALSEQGVDIATTTVDAVVGGEDAAEVARAAALLRAGGARVRMTSAADGGAVRAEADLAGAPLALLARDGVVAELGAGGRVLADAPSDAGGPR